MRTMTRRPALPTNRQHGAPTSRKPAFPLGRVPDNPRTRTAVLSRCRCADVPLCRWPGGAPWSVAALTAIRACGMPTTRQAERHGVRGRALSINRPLDMSLKRRSDPAKQSGIARGRDFRAPTGRAIIASVGLRHYLEAADAGSLHMTSVWPDARRALPRKTRANALKLGRFPLFGGVVVLDSCLWKPCAYRHTNHFRLLTVTTRDENRSQDLEVKLKSDRRSAPLHPITLQPKTNSRSISGEGRAVLRPETRRR